MSRPSRKGEKENEAESALVPKLRFSEFNKPWSYDPLSEFIHSLDAGVSVNSGDRPANQHEYGVLKTSAVTNGVFQPEENKVVLEESEQSRLRESVRGGTIIISRMNTPALVGANAYVVSSHDNLFLPDRLWAAKPKEGVSMRFLSFILGSDRGRAALSKLAKGSSGSMKNISKPEVLAFTVVAPSLAEQQKIAECLTSIDELIAAQAGKVDALKAHKQGLMQQLFPREGETQPRLRFPEFQNAGEWECQTLAHIAKISSGTTPLRSNAEFFAGGTIPWVKTTDLNNSFITQTEECITPKARARINPAGSIVVAMYGGFKQIGRTGCLTVPAATNQALSVLVLDQNRALPVYVLAWLNAKVEDWKRIASSSRKDPNITGTDVAKFPISLPSPAEQQRIASFLSNLEALITAKTQKLEALKTHKKGLMQQLFPSTGVNEI